MNKVFFLLIFFPTCLFAQKKGNTKNEVAKTDSSSSIVFTDGQKKYLDSAACKSIALFGEKINSLLANHSINRNSYQEIRDLFVIVDTIKTDIEGYYYQKDTLFYYDFLKQNQASKIYWDVDNYVNGLKIQFRRLEREGKTSTWRLHTDSIRVEKIVKRKKAYKGFDYFVLVNFDLYFQDELSKEKTYIIEKQALCAIIDKEKGEKLPLPKVKIADIAVSASKRNTFDKIDIHGIFIKKTEKDDKNKVWKLHLIDSLYDKKSKIANDHSFVLRYWKDIEFYERKNLKSDAKGILQVPMPLHSGNYKVDFFSQQEKLLNFSTAFAMDSANNDTAYLRIKAIKNTEIFEGDSIEFFWTSMNVETFRIDFVDTEGKTIFKNHSVIANTKHKNFKIKAELGKHKEQSLKIRVIAHDRPQSENTVHTYEQEIIVRKKPKELAKKGKEKPKKKGFWARLFGK